MKFSIGEFSKITKLSVKSLRLYHEKGLLVPAVIDEFTKYRYYNEDNYEKARSIKILKEYDFTLAEIKEILTEFNDEGDILEHIQNKLAEVKTKIQRYNEISQSLETIIKNEKESEMKIDEGFEIEEKVLPTILIAGYKMKGKYQDVDKGFKILGRTFGRYINGKAINLYYDGEYKEDDANFEPCFPVSKGKSTDDIKVRELKGGRCVAVIHKGKYENISDSYKKIFAYINEQGYKTLLPSREVYIKGPGMIFKGNPNNYLTEIQIMIDNQK